MNNTDSSQGIPMPFVHMDQLLAEADDDSDDSDEDSSSEDDSDSGTSSSCPSMHMEGMEALESSDAADGGAFRAGGGGTAGEAQKLDEKSTAEVSSSGEQGGRDEVEDEDSSFDAPSEGVLEDEDDDDDDGNSSATGSCITKDSEWQKSGLSTKDDEKVKYLRVVVCLSLLVIGAITSGLTYMTLKNVEEADVENTFETTVALIESNVHAQSSKLVEELETFSNQITVYALASGETFPNVTLPYFDASGRYVTKHSSLERITYAPIVTMEEQTGWEVYSNQSLYERTSQVEYMISNTAYNKKEKDTAKLEKLTITPYIHKREQDTIVPVTPPGPYLPVFQMSPTTFESTDINFDVLSIPAIAEIFPNMMITRAEPLLSNIMDVGGAMGKTIPKSVMMYPIYTGIDMQSSDIGGALLADISWDDYFVDILGEKNFNIVIEIRDPAFRSKAYEVNRTSAIRLDTGSRGYNDWQQLAKGNAHHSASFRLFPSSMAPLLINETAIAGDLSRFTVHVSSSTEDVRAFSEPYLRWSPGVYAAVVAAAFVIITFLFLLYDRYIQARNQKLLLHAARTTQYVASMFPSTVHDRLFGSHDDAPDAASENKSGSRASGSNKKTKRKKKRKFSTKAPPNPNAANKETSSPAPGEMFKSKPIADLFPNTTIMFADLAGFTAWSSTREPAQVFVLLETVYNAFDVMANKRGVFKVETVGDCYVAVAGLPEPREDHAVAMARFARDVVRKMDELARQLELTLGPDTSDLRMRVGLHSGPVTGGVIRGQRSRFQLFGDTMNTASRVETTGAAGKIHISQSTADLLTEAGKSIWFTAREEKVYAKGKGEMQTYWLKMGRRRRPTGKAARPKKFVGSVCSSEEMMDIDFDYDSDESDTSFTDSDDLFQNLVSEKTSRLIEWNVSILQRHLKHVIAQRKVQESEPLLSSKESKKNASKVGASIDEVKEAIDLPECKPEDLPLKPEEVEDFEIEKSVIEELRDYVTNIAVMYRNNKFHNFEHATHVLMSVAKYLSRISPPQGARRGGGNINAEESDKSTLALRNYLYDPLTHFACLFSALIHDVDHPGVPNSTLVREGSDLAQCYSGKSVAEQNSLDISWELLMDSTYSGLRSAICGTSTGEQNFRQLLVNSVLATDLLDKDIRVERDSRWKKALAVEQNDKANLQLKATLIIEYLVQASDIAHTMQHWQVYRKWNDNLFLEMLDAFRDGRSDEDPSEFWYEGELMFFDFCVIPLARKLKDCGVFGSTSEEGLDYATKNRQEWEVRGKEVVQELVTRYMGKGQKPVIMNLPSFQPIMTNSQKLDGGSVHSGLSAQSDVFSVISRLMEKAGKVETDNSSKGADSVGSREPKKAPSGPTEPKKAPAGSFEPKLETIPAAPIVNGRSASCVSLPEDFETDGYMTATMDDTAETLETSHSLGDVMGKYVQNALKAQGEIIEKNSLPSPSASPHIFVMSSKNALFPDADMNDSQRDDEAILSISSGLSDSESKGYQEDDASFQ